MLSPEEIAALMEAGVSAVELAEKAGVHLRTAYKWLSRRKPPAPAVAVPPDFDRAAALHAAIDHAIAALPDQSNATLDRLITLARVAKLLGLNRHDRNAAQDAETQKKLAENIGRLLDNPPAPGEPGHALAQAIARELEKLPDDEPPPPEPARKPAENPWLAPLQKPRDWREGAAVRNVGEPPQPTSLKAPPVGPLGKP